MIKYFNIENTFIAKSETIGSYEDHYDWVKVEIKEVYFQDKGNYSKIYGVGDSVQFNPEALFDSKEEIINSIFKVRYIK